MRKQTIETSEMPVKVDKTISRRYRILDAHVLSDDKPITARATETWKRGRGAEQYTYRTVISNVQA